MTRILSLFQQKTHYLEKFLGINLEAVSKFENGDFTQLESFYCLREDILKVLTYIDDQMNQAQNEIDRLGSDETKSLKEILKLKDDLVQQIMNVDVQILAAIDREKSAIIRELQEVKRSKSAIGKYKSGMTSHRLNEKA